jgi:hypothetical protein
VGIRQTPRGWLIKEWGEYTNSAAEALRKVTKGLPEGVAVVIEWDTMNKLGTLVVKALSGQTTEEKTK